MKFLGILKILSILAILVGYAACSGEVVSLDSTNFASKLSNLEKVWVVKFYSEMCGSCKEFEPTWTKVQDKIKNDFFIGKVNIDTKEGMEVARKFIDEVGIPSIAVFRSSDLSKSSAKNVEDFTVDQVINFIKSRDDI